MTDAELLELKKQLQATLLNDVKHLIGVKHFNATCIGVAVGVSKHWDDSVLVDILVDKPNSSLIIKLTVHFRNNLSDLFTKDSWPAFGFAVPSNLAPLDLARCRILRAVFLGIKNINKGSLDFMIGKNNNWVEALYDGHMGVAHYIKGK